MEVQYVAVKPLPVQLLDGKRLTLQRGDVVPEEVEGRWLENAFDDGRVVIAAGTVLSDATDEALKAELETRGYRVTRAKAAARAA